MSERYMNTAWNLRRMVDNLGGFVVQNVDDIDEIMENMPYRNMPEESYKVIMLNKEAFVYRIRNMKHAENVEAFLEKKKLEIVNFLVKR